MKKLLLSLVCILLIFSCKSDDPEPENPLFLLKEIRTNGSLLVAYEYNNDSSLSKISNYYMMEIVNEETFSYIVDTIKSQFYEDGILKYRKTYYTLNDDMVTVEQFDTLNQLNGVWQYKFAGNSCGQNELKYFNEEATLALTETYSYTNDCDAMVTIENSADLDITCTIKRDNFNKAGRSTQLPLLREPAKGNIIEFIKVDSNQDTLVDESYRSIYNYDEDGYPSVETRSYLNGIEQEFVFFFIL